MGTQKLPSLSGSKICKALCSDGFQQVSQKGGHVKLKKRLDNGKVLVTTVPIHGKVGKDLLRAIINQTGFTRESFLELL